ncbi:hypothetical protein [Caproicibacterium amylolyticum]|uniref:Uncharacterized protein n=1 Tax=Caproicibacterium amylolyticum TaxID=2766537 RepID=A0A7G9WG68_9FIRM|nr:hypothetical protein [Caproicibacterium amylolyticum]QNO17680.1 hypothetical protein H6X83_12235 [Caproicibacterium amylolyticum]
MEEKTCEKKIHFYRAISEPSFKASESTNNSERLRDLFNGVFSEGKSCYEYDNNDVKNRFEILSIDNKELFATYSKEEVSINPLMQIRDRITNATEDILNNAQEALEYYTFFYVNFSNGILAVIFNKQASLDNALREYCFEKNYRLSLLPFIADDKESVLHLFKKIKHITFTFTKESASDYKCMPEIRDSGIEIDGLQIKLKVSKHRESIIKYLVSLRDGIYSSVKVDGKSNDDIDQSFDLIQKSFMRKSSILLSTNPKNHLDDIKSAMQKEINKISHNKII